MVEKLDQTNILKNKIEKIEKEVTEKLNENNTLKDKIKKLEEKLNVFNITEGYISVNKRIVRAKDGVDGYDLVTKAYVDNAIENKCKSIEKIHIGEQV